MVEIFYFILELCMVFAISVYLQDFLVKEMGLFVLRHKDDYYISKLKCEPHYSLVFSAIRYVFSLSLFAFFIYLVNYSFLGITLFGKCLIYSVVILGVTLMSVIFWYVSSFYVDRSFHQKHKSNNNIKKICLVRTHKPLDRKKLDVYLVLFVVAIVMLLILAWMIWLPVLYTF